MTLIEHLTLVEETRSEINRKHNLVDVMFLVISAIMSGAEGWNDIETYGDSKIDWLRQHRPFANGIPRRHTVARILRCIVIDTLLEALLCWVNVRQHWRIENSQHYILDVVFNEDASRIAMEDAVENMALFRRFVLNIVKQSNCGARSQRNKLKRAGWNDDYRAQLFFG
ncbi:transposase family protein [Aeromonas caviae]|uniref:transposase family protein n=1 Tax=Aeromonas caviae TaxID=648 RepID=UPI00214F032F|nr:transposase family protein [Aeromonas caviae]MCR3985735.1 transposase family protein [Aeromonas caviae]